MNTKNKYSKGNTSCLGSLVFHLGLFFVGGGWLVGSVWFGFKSRGKNCEGHLTCCRDLYHIHGTSLSGTVP